MGTAMGTKLYANLSVGFLEETVLFPVKLPKYFPHDNYKLIEDYSKDIWMTVFSHGILHWILMF